METWRYKIKGIFPSSQFVLILSFDGEETILRFHKLRNDEPHWVNVESIEDYSEGVLVIVV
ncbi:hypothetical protein NXZ84_04830 [Mechercharimyces sp. CAU 1602]|nr:hypothetical protein [Mechercharimyces sp. CAU 1602]